MPFDIKPRTPEQEARIKELREQMRGMDLDDPARIPITDELEDLGFYRGHWSPSMCRKASFKITEAGHNISGGKAQMIKDRTGGKPLRGSAHWNRHPDNQRGGLAE